MSKDLTHLCLPPTVLVVSEFVLDRIHWYQKLLTEKSDLHFPKLYWHVLGPTVNIQYLNCFAQFGLRLW